MKYYEYTYPNGDTEYYSLVDGDLKRSVRTGRVECIGVSKFGPSSEWLEKNAVECPATQFNEQYNRVMNLITSWV